MGKKHKKESKKRRRSRSRSASRSEEKEVEKERRKHHKRHHKEKKKEKERSHKKPKASDPSSGSDDDVEFVCETVKGEKKPTPPPPPKISSPSPPPAPAPPQISSKDAPQPKESGSLSIDETNALRAKLGLKPLQTDTGPSSSSTEKPDFVHKPAEDLTRKKETEKIRARLAERKEKRAIEKRLLASKSLGDPDDEEDANSWVSKSRTIEMQRKLAEKKAKELDEMEEEFGLGDLINQEIIKEKSTAYTSSHIKDLSVKHAVDDFKEGRAVILTLDDKGVLEEGEDELVNVNMVDDERYKKNVFNKTQRAYGFNGELEQADELFEKKLLSKYDEEIEGVKVKKFKLGEANDKISVKDSIKKRLVEKAKMELVTLDEPRLKLASDYFTEEEMKAKFKKPKKIKKVRRKVLKASDLLEMAGDETRPTDLGSRNPKEPDEDAMEVETPAEEEASLKVEPVEEETELELALRKARRLKQLEQKPPLSVEKIGLTIKREPEEEEATVSSLTASGSIILNSTAEFCRTLGDIPTYGLSGNRDDEAQDLLDFEKDTPHPEQKKPEKSAEKGGWNDAEMDEKLVDIKPTEAPILDAEPDLGAGVAGALRMAVSKGYLEKETSNRPSAARFAHLQAQNYSIEDKTHVDDEKFGRRERYMGPTMDFKEKDTYKPNIKLEYIDDEGHLLSAKEAFRYLSHKFHGKGPGKNKVEKRMKKGEQQALMKQMSSTDTPLGTLQMLQQKQKETQSAFVLLSGTKQQSLPTSIAKAKFK